ncbi:hypothetical protein ACFQYP_60095 [Nonomuraea antimicrobica]
MGPAGPMVGWVATSCAVRASHTRENMPSVSTRSTRPSGHPPGRTRPSSGKTSGVMSEIRPMSIVASLHRPSRRCPTRIITMEPRPASTSGPII